MCSGIWRTCKHSVEGVVLVRDLCYEFSIWDTNLWSALLVQINKFTIFKVSKFNFKRLEEIRIRDKIRIFEIWWDLLRSVEIYWDLLSLSIIEINWAWDLLRFIEFIDIIWILLCLLRHIENCWDFLRNIEIYWDLLRFFEISWNL